MREVGVLEAKTNLSALLDEVAQGGEEIMITRHGKPIARLSAASNEAPRVRKLSGAELSERFRLLREQISRENPETDALTWEELKKMAHE
ncbi:MAG: prevent-host-death family protein [Phenylobacterium sp.]|nr:prevent-host-death family protein [Phenylobacterium sp.]